jgi:SAM-dependent methyltransferase
MLERDVTLESLESWLEYAEAHPDVYDIAASGLIAERIKLAGFTEPLTGRVVHGQDIDASHSNWREGLIANGISSRTRGVLALIAEETKDRNINDVLIYGTEAVTALALLLRGVFPRYLGSEYGLDERARDDLYPIPHQDLTALTLPSDMFDIVTTNEVLEHVPDLDAALEEIARVLKPGGVHIGTHPFMFDRNEGDLRAQLQGGALVHLKPPEFHGNPVDPEGGSLVFETPGWNILERARAAGFAEACMRFVASERNGYVTENTGVFVLFARK